MRVAPKAIYILVSNPVDVLTYVFHKISGLPEHQIIGSGTILDTSRLQSALAKRFFISPKNVHAHVYGEHGDSSFVPWSLVHIANNHVNVYKDSSPDRERITWKGEEEYEAIEQFVKTSGGQVIKAKGATFYAVAMSVCHLCKCVMSTAGTALTVSTMMHGEYGVEDVPVDAGAGRYHRRSRQDHEPSDGRRGFEAAKQREQAQGSHQPDHVLRRRLHGLPH